MSTDKTKPDRNKWAKWERWLEKIERNIDELLIRREVWESFNDTVRKQSSDSPLRNHGFWFVSRFAAMYAESQAIGIRRQAESKGDVVTLGNLLKEMNENPQTVQAFGLWPICDAQLAEDRHVLSETALPLKNYVDKRIAHMDKASEVPTPTFGELASALDQVVTLVKRYWAVFCDATYDPQPVFADPWMEIFYHPWLPGTGEGESE